jgi:hypothetical protein
VTKIRMLQQMSGYRNGEPWPGYGETMDVHPDEAATLTAGQTPIAEYAEDVDRTFPEEERATAPEPEVPVETATLKTSAPRTRTAAAKATPSSGPATRSTAAKK